MTPEYILDTASLTLFVTAAIVVIAIASFLGFMLAAFLAWVEKTTSNQLAALVLFFVWAAIYVIVQNL